MRFLTICSLAGGLAAPALLPAQFTELIVFGDSYVDTGRRGDAQDFVNPGADLWVEHLATGLGLSAAPWKSPGDPDRNFAFGGARIYFDEADDNDALTQDAPEQRASFQSELAGGSAPSDALYVINFGLNGVLGTRGSASTEAEFQAVGADIATQVVSFVDSLADLGARNFLVSDALKLGMLPVVAAGAGGWDYASANLAAQGFNNALASGLDGLGGEHAGARFTMLDSYGLFESIEGDPGAFGFTDITTAFKGTDQSGEVSDYLWWDSVHLTGAGHQLLGDEALQAASLTAVPEPGTTALIMGVLALGGIAWRRRKTL